MGIKHKSMHYHEIALNYFQRGMKLIDGRWIFSSCIADQLREIAFLYIEQDNFIMAEQKYIRAIQILRKAAMEDSGLNHCLMLGDFNFEFAKMFEGFKNHNRIRWALNQYKLAEIDGCGHYTAPYYGQVKCYYHLYDFDGCLDTLQKCKDQFTNEYSTHNFKEMKEDDDFEEILPLLEQLK